MLTVTRNVNVTRELRALAVAIDTDLLKNPEKEPIDILMFDGEWFEKLASIARRKLNLPDDAFIGEDDSYWYAEVDSLAEKVIKLNRDYVKKTARTIMEVIRRRSNTDLPYNSTYRRLLFAYNDNDYNALRKEIYNK